MNLAKAKPDRIEKSRREYNQLVANDSLEDYALRYTPSHFRKWSELLLANTAMGSISFLALEAIGASIGILYGFTNAFWAILCAASIIFLCGVPICYHAARNNIDIDLLTRGAGFGYIGSTITSLIYASFSFIFFALEAAIMAQAIHLYFAMPLSWAYLFCALIIIPLVFYGISFINRLQLWTQPIWITMMVLPFVMILTKDPSTIDTLTSLIGTASGDSGFNPYYFGLSMGVSLSLIAQIGEQVDYLRFMPTKTEENRVRWWFSLLLSGPGWIILGFLKQIGGMFLASLAIVAGLSIAGAKEPIHMYTTGYHYVVDNPEMALLLATVFVIISQIKINVTNAYAGSLAWSNFFSRLTHAHPGRVIWVIFNVMIALLLMEMGVFEVLSKVLGFYSNVAIAWIGALVADLVINKPLGLSPKIIEFKRAHLYRFNPVGCISMLLASIISIAAFFGLFGIYAQAYSSLIALMIALVLSPLIAWITKGKYYLARDISIPVRQDARTTLVCEICEHSYEYPDMAHCPFHQINICSLCCTLDSRCHDSCKSEGKLNVRDSIAIWLSRLLGKRISLRYARRLIVFTTLTSVLMVFSAFVLWALFVSQSSTVPSDIIPYVQQTYTDVFYLMIMVSSILAWWVLLIHESRDLAEQELTEQNATLEEARAIAEAANRSKTDFLANMSHEIRTPMNAIIGMTHLAKQTELTAKQKDYIDKADAAAHSLLGIINDILDFSKIEAGKLEIEAVRFNLEAVLKNLATMTDINAHQKGLEIYFSLDADLPRFLVGDPLRLGQVLLNLTSNAIKFTEHGEITIFIKTIMSLRPLNENQMMLEFSVEDTGIGLSATQIEKLFSAFSQADSSTTRNYGGTGLGLVISKQLVKLMGGSIRVESVLGKGSRFIFTAMFGLQDRDRQVDLHTRETFSGMRTLVVDDSATSRKIMKYYMEAFSFRVDVAASGEEALTMLEHAEQPYQLVLMDWKMPGMDGIETTRRIKNHQNLKHMPTIIMVTAHARDEVMQQAEEVGLDGFLIKPVGQSQLFETLLNTFGHIIQGDGGRHGLATQKEDLTTIAGAHILVVEDNAINQQIAREILQQAGLHVTLANNGMEGVAKVREEAFDVVLMDLQMPEMDGYEATKTIRQDGRFNDLPIIAMTAHTMVGEKERCLAAGMNGHTAKPIDLEHLFALLRQWIKPRRALQVEMQPMKGKKKAVPPDPLLGIDVNSFLKNIGGNRSLLESLLLEFQQEFADTATTIRTLLDQDEITAAQRLAHRIKGTAGNLAAMPLYDAATRLDAALRKEERDALAELLGLFETELNIVMASIASLQQRSVSTTDATNLDREAITPLLDELTTLIKENRMDADQCFQRLKGELHYPAVQQQMQQLEAAIHNFDFETAQATLDHIAKKITLNGSY